MIKKVEIDVDVVTAATQRVKNIFGNGQPVELSMSGGKDSICLANIVYELCVRGEVDKSLLTVDFIDEEAIFPCVERVAKNWRMKWLSIGVKFRWWCIECRHFNCFNTLTQDESFIMWDRYKKDVWVREMPSFAITSHPLLRPRKDTYQEFMNRLLKDSYVMVGLRTSESLMRLNALAKKKKYEDKKYYPIYDWGNTDVWRYIRDRNLEFPEIYMYLYQTGAGRGEMRVSQFFSVDTAKSLVNMNQYYPRLHERICKREPNAYMAMLYFDTELFRRKKEPKGEKDKTDYKAKTLELLADDAFFDTEAKVKQRKKLSKLITLHGALIKPTIWRQIYNALVGGDPKDRAYRAIVVGIFSSNKPPKKR